LKPREALRVSNVGVAIMGASALLALFLLFGFYLSLADAYRQVCSLGGPCASIRLFMEPVLIGLPALFGAILAVAGIRRLYDFIPEEAYAIDT